jgi:hypothetical protein
MALTVEVTVKGDIAKVLADVKKLAAQKDVKFTGDTTKGSFAGAGIKGTYTVKGQDITIVVTDTPWYAPDSKVKEAIQEWFKGK